MASIIHDRSTKTRRIGFTAPDGKRKTLRLGKLPKKDAEAVRVKVESLLASRITGQPIAPETARWVATLGDDLHDKLARVALVEPRGTATLGPFIGAYIKRRTPTLKNWIIVNLKQTRRYLTKYLGESRDLRTVSPGDAEDWRDAMLADGLAENTVRRATGRARQLFTAAIKRGLLDANPFDGMAANVRPERDRDYFITRDEAAAVLDACPDAEWRVMFALARFGGLRTPSETLRLRWADINWANNRFAVTSPKTEHHDGRGSRVVPLFTELLPHLRQAFQLANDGDEFVVTRYRDPGVNLRTRLLRIIKHAGLIPWPKLWQNLRATRATELAQTYPQYVATDWLGHSAKVAEAHYLQVTAEHFTTASQPAAAQQTERTDDNSAVCDERHHEADDKNPENRNAKHEYKAARNPTQYPPARGRNEPQSPKKNRTQPRRNALRCGMMPVTGVEPVLP